MDSSPTNSGFVAPTGSKLLGEIAGVLQVPRLAFRTPQLLRLPRGDQTVMAFPGFGTGDAFTLPLRSALRALGHTPFGWGFGVNTGEVEEMLDSVTLSVEQRAEQTGARLALIGWSLGGIFAREVARDRPDLVTQVITYGTPIFGGPRFTRGAKVYGEDKVSQIEVVVNERNLIPIQRPITAFHTEADAIVDWRACIDTISPDVENIKVQSTHIGMGIDPDVWEIIGRRLANVP